MLSAAECDLIREDVPDSAPRWKLAIEGMVLFTLPSSAEVYLKEEAEQIFSLVIRAYNRGLRVGERKGRESFAADLRKLFSEGQE